MNWNNLAFVLTHSTWWRIVQNYLKTIIAVFMCFILSVYKIFIQQSWKVFMFLMWLFAYLLYLSKIYHYNAFKLMQINQIYCNMYFIEIVCIIHLPVRQAEISRNRKEFLANSCKKELSELLLIRWKRVVLCKVWPRYWFRQCKWN